MKENDIPYKSSGEWADGWPGRYHGVYGYIDGARPLTPRARLLHDPDRLGGVANGSRITCAKKEKRLLVLSV